MIFIINGQIKTSFINLLEDFVYSSFKLATNFCLTRSIDFKKFIVDLFRIRFVNLDLFVFVIKKGKISALCVGSFHRC